MSVVRLSLVAAALAALLLSGCTGLTGLPEGSANTGDLVTVRYTATDLESGQVLRVNRTASFDVGSGASGLGAQFERAVRGRSGGESFEVTIRDDPSLQFDEAVRVPRLLADIPTHQTAPLDDFRQFVGEPTVGLSFPAYGIYTGVVTGSTNETVEFNVQAEDGQQDPVPSVGAVLVTHVLEGRLTRELDPTEGATFTIQPPSPYQPSTPLGLQPGSYRVVGADGDEMVLAYSSTTEGDLVGKDLRFTITVIAVTQKGETVPTDGNFGVRTSPQVKGDPYAAIADDAVPHDEPVSGTGDGHDH